MTRKIQGFDVGGSSVKAGLLDVEGGRLVGELISAPTPQPSTPQSVMEVIAGLSRRMPEAEPGIGIALPSVVQKGHVKTAANIDHSWIGTDATALAQKVIGRPAEVLNDADAAGVAEMRWGAGKGEDGVVFMLTFGTGIGSALFYNGQLVPNTELGHLELRGMDAEKWASAHVKTVLNLDWQAWIERVNDYLARMHALFWPDLFILGGAVSADYDRFARLLRAGPGARIQPAHFAGQAGVIGAALAAAEAGPR
jgi:polyphosphate glucokinase